MGLMELQKSLLRQQAFPYGSVRMKGITKDQLCWIIIRCLGIFCLVQTITSLFLLVQTGSAFDGGAPGSGISSTIGWLVFGNGLFAIYCLAGGATLHRILMSESPVRKREWDDAPKESPKKEPLPPPTKSSAPKEEPVNPETQLTEKETVQFHAWLEQHPEFAKRALEDKIALFRDAQGRGEI